MCVLPSAFETSEKPSSILHGWGAQGVRSAEYAIVFARSCGGIALSIRPVAFRASLLKRGAL